MELTERAGMSFSIKYLLFVVSLHGERKSRDYFDQKIKNKKKTVAWDADRNCKNAISFTTSSELSEARGLNRFD